MSYATLKALKEQRAKLALDGRALLDVAEKEKRDLTQEEEAWLRSALNEAARPT